MNKPMLAALVPPDQSAIITFGLYTAVVLALAWFSHRVRTGRSFLSEYFLGSRGLGVIAFTLTFGATSASAGSFAGVPSLIYSHGWSVALWISSYMVVPLCAMALLGKRLNQVSRSTGAITLPEILRERFGSPRLEAISSLLLIFMLSLYLIPQFKLASLILKQLLAGSHSLQIASAWITTFQHGTGWFTTVDSEYLICLLFFAVIVVVYTTFGGFRAVVWTDVLQGFIMLCGIGVLLILTLRQAGGLTAATTEVAKQVPPKLGHVQFSTDRPSVQSLRIASETWFSTTNESTGQRRLFRTNEVAVIPAGGTTSRPVKAVELVDSSRESGAVPRSIQQLPEHVDPRLEGFEPYAYGADDQGAYLRCPGPSATNPAGFLSLGLAISMFIYWPLSGTGQPGNMVRLMAFRDSRTLKRSIALLSLYFGVIYFSLVIVFCSARAVLPGLDHTPDRIMPVLSFQISRVAQMPWLAGLLVAAPFAAAMSTVDSFMLMISSAMVRDIYQRNINPDCSEKRIKRMSYACMALVGIAVTLGAVNPPRFMQYLIVFTGGGLSVSFLVPVAMALYWPRTTSSGAAAAMISGFLVYLGLYVAGYIINGSARPLNVLEVDPLIWGFAASIVVGITVSYLGQPPPETLVARFFWKTLKRIPD